MDQRIGVVWEICLAFLGLAARWIGDVALTFVGLVTVLGGFLPLRFLRFVLALAFKVNLLKCHDFP